MARFEIRFPAADIISAGALAGAVMAAFLMVVCALFVNVNAVFQPLRMVAAMLLGSTVLDSGYSPGVASVTGFALHMSLSVLFAFGFSACVNPLWQPSRLIGAGMILGTALWIINVYVVANVIGWTWFVERDVPALSFVAHAILYGGLLGWSLSAAQPVIAART